MTHGPPAVHALVRFGLNTPDAAGLLHFYERAFGAQALPPPPHGAPHDSRLVGAPGEVGRVARTRLHLGDATLEFCQFDVPGRPYPRHLPPDDPRFQHICIVVSDLRAALERLSQIGGWSAISNGGPQVLPLRSGGVTAFKFRDPDGHPLEFLQFAAGQVPAHWRSVGRNALPLGIDHSAISVGDAGRSVRFYESLGLQRTGQTLNQGAAQERLDGVPAPMVDVIALTPRQPAPHVELLHYRGTVRPADASLAVNDSAATRLVFAAVTTPGDPTEHLIRDPDGHFLQFE